MLYFHWLCSLFKKDSDMFGWSHPHPRFNADGIFTVRPHQTAAGACGVCTLAFLKVTWLHSLRHKACGFLFDWQNGSSPLPPLLLLVTALFIPVTSQISSPGIKGWSGCPALWPEGSKLVPTRGQSWWANRKTPNHLFYSTSTYLAPVKQKHVARQHQARWS